MASRPRSTLLSLVCLTAVSLLYPFQAAFSSPQLDSFISYCQAGEKSPAERYTLERLKQRWSTANCQRLAAQIAPLTQFRMSADQLTALRVFSFFPALKILDLSSRKPLLLGQLEGAKGIEQLIISAPQADFSGLTAIAHSLEVLALNDATLGSVRQLPPLPQVTGLHLARAGLTDIEGLGRFGSLITLKIGRNKVRDISPLEALSQLKELDLSYNPIVSLQPLSKLTALRDFTGAGLELVNVPEFALPNRIAHLDLKDNRLTDISALAGFTELCGRLDLSHNEIGDLEALQALTKMAYLRLSHNRVETLAPVSGLKELNTLEMWENPLGTDIAKTETNCPTKAASVGVREWCKRRVGQQALLALAKVRSDCGRR